MYFIVILGACGQWLSHSVLCPLFLMYFLWVLDASSFDACEAFYTSRASVATHLN